jgi:hypothetical protein
MLQGCIELLKHSTADGGSSTADGGIKVEVIHFHLRFEDGKFVVFSGLF